MWESLDNYSVRNIYTFLNKYQLSSRYRHKRENKTVKILLLNAVSETEDRSTSLIELKQGNEAYRINYYNDYLGSSL
jgi:hypothetical protein